VALDIESLLREITPESPCGDNLEYDADFGALERAAQGKGERQIGDTIVAAEEPNWRELKANAVELLARTKDLRVAAYLSTAALHLDGLSGFRDCLTLIRRMLEHYWDAVHPQLDPDDDNDPTMRINAIMTLCDAQTTLTPLRDAALITSPVFGRIAYRDIHSALTADGETQDDSVPDVATIEAAFTECELDDLRAVARSVSESGNEARQIEVLLTQHLGAASAPSLDDLIKPLGSIGDFLTQQLTRRGAFDVPSGVPDEEMDEGQRADPGQGPAQAITGEIQSRDDVIQTLNKICEYYQRHEPSSPIPLLLQRAKRLAAKDFLEIIRDLAPDGLPQAESIGGVDHEDDSESD